MYMKKRPGYAMREGIYVNKNKISKQVTKLISHASNFGGD